MLDILQSRGVTGVLPICDRDYDDHLGRSRTGVIYVDFNDAEIMTIHSDALHRVLAELRPDRFSDDDRDAVVRFRDHVVAMAAQVGRIRLLSHRANLGLAFREVDIGDHLIESDLNLGSYVSALLASSRASAASHDSLVTTGLAASPARSGTSVAAGHDCCSLVASLCNMEREHILTSAVVEMSLRLAFDAACFQRTELVVRIQEWEAITGLEVLDPAVLA